MAASRSFLLLLISTASLYVCISCKQNQMDEREAILTANGEGMYWDEVCSSNALGRYNLILRNTSGYNSRLNGLPIFTLMFSSNHKLMYYFNQDSTTIVDMNIVTGDVQYNPSKWEIMNNKIRLIGDTCEILLLNKEVLVIKTIKKSKALLRVYVPSYWQNKVLCRDYTCDPIHFDPPASAQSDL